MIQSKVYKVLHNISHFIVDFLFKNRKRGVQALKTVKRMAQDRYKLAYILALCVFKTGFRS